MKFTEVLDRLGVTYKATGHEHCRPGWLQTDCPGCSPGWGHYRLGFHLGSSRCSCWACGRKNRVEMLSILSGQKMGLVREVLGDLQTERRREEERQVGVYKPPPQVGPLGKAHKSYLARRGFDWKELESLWKIQGIGGAAGMLSWRIFIPVFLEGEPVSWTTRSISDGHARRYHSARMVVEEKYNHKDLLYGADNAGSAVVICEGPFDVWAIGPGAVCTFGTGFRQAQVRKLAEYPFRYVCYDAQPEGQKQAEELCRRLSPFEGETYNVTLESGKDPGEASWKELKKLRKLLA